jgi:hypothetical protein
MPSIADSMKIDKELLTNLYLRANGSFDTKYVYIEFNRSKEYEEYLSTQDQVEEITTYSDKILVKFKLNKIQEEINKIYINGKYSTFPNSYKMKILNYFNQPKSSKLGQVLFKLPILKKKLENQLNIRISDEIELGVKTNIIEESYE